VKGTARIAWLGALVWAIFVPPQAHAQGSVFESTPRFEVNIVIESSGDLEITETIVQEFGSTLPIHPEFGARVDELGNVVVRRR